MSLSDLELLQLVDTVKAKQRGPKGETGVGISEIDQFDETGFTIRLTDGSFKRINLPAPKDGGCWPSRACWSSGRIRQRWKGRS